MNTLLKVRQLVFNEKIDESGPYYVAYTPFGYYEYGRDSEGADIDVVAQFEDGSDSGEFARCGNAVTAQRLCNDDFTARILMAITLENKE